jgi:hypothetical protein
MNTTTIKNHWKHVTVNEDLARLCIRDHKNLGEKRNEIQKMVNAIGLVVQHQEMYKCLSGPSGTTFILKIFGGNMMYSIKSQTINT